MLQALLSIRHNLVLAVPDAKLDCAHETGGRVKVPISLEHASHLSPGGKVRLSPRHVRLTEWPDRLV